MALWTFLACVVLECVGLLQASYTFLHFAVAKMRLSLDCSIVPGVGGREISGTVKDTASSDINLGKMAVEVLGLALSSQPTSLLTATVDSTRPMIPRYRNVILCSGVSLEPVFEPGRQDLVLRLA